MNPIEYFRDMDGHLVWIRLKEFHSGVNRVFLGQTITGFSPASNDTAFVHVVGGETVRVRESYEYIIRYVVLGNSYSSEGVIHEWTRRT